MIQELYGVKVETESKESVWNFLHMDLPINKTGFFIMENNFKNYFPEIYNKIKQIKWCEYLPFKQLLWHYLQDDFDLNLGNCIICNKRCKFKNFKIGYRYTCSAICNYINPIKKEKYKQTCLKKYGVENSFCSEQSIFKSQQTKLKKYGNVNYTNLEKYKQTCKERYGVDNYAKTEDCKSKVRNTFKTKYGTNSWANSVNGKLWYANKHNVEHKTHTTHQTKLQKYGNKNYNNYDKWCKTHKFHKSWNISKIELQLKEYFENNNIIFKYQYRDERYPFVCDFYFPDKDLFVEIQGSWTHGGKPFNPETDLTIVQEWLDKNSKYYKNAIETWTIRDVKKREIAKKNNLNYLEIFSCDFNECIEKINKLITINF